MSHELYISNGRANMAYQGKTPWHGLGKSMPDGATFKEWIEAAGFDFTLNQAVVEFTDTDGISHDMINREVIYRSDTKQPISCMSDNYKIVQPSEVMSFFEDVCESQGYTMETAGVLGKGAKYWALCKVNGGMVAGDETKKHVLLATSADGTMATTAKFTATRVVCQNTLSWSLENKDGKPIKVRHSSIFDADKIKRELGLVDWDASWDDFRTTMEKLDTVKVSDQAAKEFFAELLRPKQAKQDMRANTFSDLIGVSRGMRVQQANEKADRAIRGLDTLIDCYHAAPGARPGSAYGLIQGVTRYIDHERGQDPEKRLQSAWFGQGAAMKQQAVENAKALTI